MIRSIVPQLCLAAALSCTAGCSLFGSSAIPTEAPPLVGMNEPPALLGEPSDELERAALDPGSFTGIEVVDARASLDALLEAPDGLSVARVVENSPAALAGIGSGDVLFTVRKLPDGAESTLGWPSDWRDVELNTPPGTEIEVSLDRAGVTKRARITLAPRLKPAERVAAARLREDQRAGIVVRGATEVEARKAGL
ncbi:MAG: S1C family serine protease, partial [Planctomycetota bacterium]